MLLDAEETKKQHLTQAPALYLTANMGDIVSQPGVRRMTEGVKSWSPSKGVQVGVVKFHNIALDLLTNLLTNEPKATPAVMPIRDLKLAEVL